MGNLFAPEYKNGTITLDIGQITTQLSEAKGGKLRDSRAWAVRLDGSLKSELRQAINRNLVSPSNMAIFAIYDVVTDIATHATLHTYALDRAFDPTMIAVWAAIQGKSIRNTRMSTTIGLHLDRLALAHGGLAMKPIIKPV